LIFATAFPLGPIFSFGAFIRFPSSGRIHEWLLSGKMFPSPDLFKNLFKNDDPINSVNYAFGGGEKQYSLKRRKKQGKTGKETKKAFDCTPD
jgi:hypothetical protein